MQGGVDEGAGGGVLRQGWKPDGRACEVGLGGASYDSLAPA